MSGGYEGEAGLMWLDKGVEAADSSAMHGWGPIGSHGSEPIPDEAGSAGQWLAERRLLADFVAAVDGGAPVAIDVYDAVTWSVVAPLSRQSIEAGSRSLDVPVFRPAR